MEEEMKQNLKDTPKAIIKCYQGNHDLCDQFSHICNENKRWAKLFCRNIKKKPYFEMTEADESTLEVLIQFRLGDKALSSTFTGSSTQKNEAFNRSLTKFNPKSVTCSKTFTGRAH